MPCALASASARWRKTSAWGLPAKSTCGGVDIHITDHSKRAGRTVGEFYGHMPVERGGIEGRGGGMHGSPDGTLQPAIDARHRRVSGRDSELYRLPGFISFSKPYLGKSASRQAPTCFFAHNRRQALPTPKQRQLPRQSVIVL